MEAARQDLLTCEPSGKFLGTFSLHHVWMDCLGSGTTTGYFGHHMAPGTLPSPTMTTIHSLLADDNVAFSETFHCQKYIEYSQQHQYAALRPGGAPRV